MTDERISVQSVTGVDLTLRLAGPGTRSYAFIIDWHFRLLLSAAWVLVAVFLLNFKLTFRSQEALFSILPAAAIYFLYHPVLELAMGGRTPGKRMAGVRIVDRQGGTPNTVALLIRNVFRLIDALPTLYVLGLTTCILSVHRVRVGDLAAGTLLVFDDAVAQKSLARIESLAQSSQLPLDILELADQILERWDALQPDSRTAIARSLLARVAPAHTDELASMSDLRLRSALQKLLVAPAAPGSHV